MSRAVALTAMLAILASGCGRTPVVAAGKEGGRSVPYQCDNHQMFAQSFFGASRITVTPNLCAGRVTLAQGSASVADSCFTGDTNVVLCTNVSAANPVRCAPARGTLLVAGTGQDMISYARVK